MSTSVQHCSLDGNLTRQHARKMNMQSPVWLVDIPLILVPTTVCVKAHLKRKQFLDPNKASDIGHILQTSLKLSWKLDKESREIFEGKHVCDVIIFWYGQTKEVHVTLNGPVGAEVITVKEDSRGGAPATQQIVQKSNQT